AEAAKPGDDLSGRTANLVANRRSHAAHQIAEPALWRELSHLLLWSNPERQQRAEAAKPGRAEERRAANGRANRRRQVRRKIAEPALGRQRSHLLRWSTPERQQRAEAAKPGDDLSRRTANCAANRRRQVAHQVAEPALRRQLSHLLLWSNPERQQRAEAAKPG